MSRDLKPRLKFTPSRSGSRGGTLIGIFVGLILGALVAAGIALYFTNASPFQKPRQDEKPVVPPPVRPQTGEPIALPGKAGDKPVEKPRFDFYNVLPKGSDALPAPSKPEETTEDIKADRPAPGDKVGKTDKAGKAGGDSARVDKAPVDSAERARAEAALLDKPAAAPEKYYLQAGAFEDPSEADNLKARLALMGVEASVQKVEVPDKGTLHRVRTGPYHGQEAMTKAREGLTSNGISTAVIKIKPKEPKPASAAQ